MTARQLLLYLTFTGATASAVEMSAGGYHAVRVSDGSVVGLGDGTYGQLGTAPAGSPATVAGLSDITAVSAGGFSTLALKSDGTVWFLGESTLQHTTPHGTPDPVSTPIQIAGLGGIDEIAAGHRHYLALDADTGDLFAWGHNGSGQVGNGGRLDVTAPALVLTGVSTMAAGDGFTLAVRFDHTLWAWGRNRHGQLGLGDTADRTSPTQVAGITTAEAVAAGGQHALVLLSGGSVSAAGDNSFGQLGLGHTDPVSGFTPVPGLSGVSEVAAGYHHSAVRAATQVSVWGRNFEGQCGGGNVSAVKFSSPQALAGITGTPVGIRCGYHFSLVELADGSVIGTGSNGDGQLDGVSVADQDDSRKILTLQTVPLSPDTTTPELDSLSPPTGSTSIAVASDLVATFNEPVMKGSGDLVIKEATGNQVVASIDVSSAAVSISGAVVTIDPPSPLANGTSYYVEVPEGAIEDLAGNAFAGTGGSLAWHFSTAVDTGASASLLSHYTFDTESAGTTPDTIGSAFATLGNRVQINSNPGLPMAGSGALEILGSGVTTGPGDGAVTSNSFAWAGDARTVTFWWRARTPNVDEGDGTFVSFGDNSANGTRFDIKEQGASNTQLRVEVQGLGQNTNPTIDDGDWHFVAVTVPDDATFGDIAWYVDGDPTDLNPSTSTLDIATGTGPIAFGDSILTVGSNTRVPNGYIDDFQLYDVVLDSTQISFLHDNPGMVIGGPVENFLSYITDPAFALDVGEQDFTDDPDRDRLANGLEAWFGTNPGDFSSGLANLTTDGTVTIFTHPLNPTRPADVTGFYEWSPNLTDWFPGDGVAGPPGGPTLTFSVATIGDTSTVTATTSEPVGRIFLRAGVRQLP
ncbi:repeat regulator of chromosome condensation domain-containing protein [Haloferula helveola]|uniref:Repeat regulator of chromosome condensation domain-containing protein n=1 Tax=Haloferula helveola TaxID=490095 RepID=A0ABN6H5Y9_9BACT|nr:repeat regulator of chromosome condensation domain-containing protein [Haloferula helveola]